MSRRFCTWIENMPEKFFDIVNEAHVQHAIDFIENDVFHLRQIQRALVDDVFQSSGCGHDNITTVANAVLLRIVLLSSVDRHNRYITGDRLEIIRDLLG